jgi:hypothetical protein
MTQRTQISDCSPLICVLCVICGHISYLPNGRSIVHTSAKDVF